MLFDPNENNNNEGMNNDNLNNDDLVDSSFAVSFKSNDPVNTVEGKLKETQDNIDDGFKDDFDDFEFDDSISAFKPLNNAPADSKLAFPEEKPAAEPANTFAPFKKAEPEMPAVDEDPKAKEEPAAFKPAPAPFKPTPSPSVSFPKDNGTFDVNKSEAPKEEPKAKAPVFDDNDADLMGFGGLKTEDTNKDKLFNSGSDLDFASSTQESAKSPFAGPKAEPQSPFAAKKEEPAEDTGIKTFGTVKSGMDAFKTPEEPKKAPSAFAPKPAEKKDTTEPVKPAVAATAAAAAATTATAFTKPAEPVKPAAPKAAEPVKPAAPKAAEPVKHEPKAAEPFKPEAPKAAEPVKAAAPKTAPQSNSGRVLNNAAPATHRPGTNEARPTAATKPTTAPTARPKPASRPMNPAFENAAARQERNAEAAKAAQLNHEAQKQITPVTPNVSKKRRKADKPVRDPGKGGVITLAVIIVLFLGVLWVLDNTEKLAGLFNGKKDVETVPTRIETEATSETTTAAPSESETTATETTTEATTTTETEATTTETSETETEATTTETSETTTEATTTTTTTEATTTEATTTTTTAATSGDGVYCVDFKTKLNHFTTTAGGFKFDITLTNKSNKDASLVLSLKEVDITLRSDATITEVTSDYFTFTGEGNKYVGVPNDVVVPGGESLTFTVYVSTSSSVSHFGYDYCYFDWK